MCDFFFVPLARILEDDFRKPLMQGALLPSCSTRNSDWQNEKVNAPYCFF